MSTEITLGGYTVEALLTMKQAVAKDATAFIAEHLEKAKGYFAELEELFGDAEYNEVEVTSEMEELARKANDAFSLVDLVSGISGVRFNIPWDREYDSTMSSKLDNLGLSYNHDVLSDLYNTLESMESDADGWYNSRC